MIRVFLRKLSEGLLQEENQSAYNSYYEMTNHSGWGTHKAFMVSVLNEISVYMLSDKFTKLEQDEKDVQQRAFFMAREIILFLLDPMKDARQMMQYRHYNKNLEVTPGERPRR